MLKFDWGGQTAFKRIEDLKVRQTHTEQTQLRRNSWLKAPFLVGTRVLTERKLHRRGLRFRAKDPEESAYAYAAMDAREFAKINACQEWANWRTIPRLLSMVHAPEPWSVIDLGCGQGLSTEVIAWYCPDGSQVLGYDLSESALSMARSRAFYHASGKRSKVFFRPQSIDESWRDLEGNILGDHSITLVNASGIIGHHLSYNKVCTVVRELRRVLSHGGWAFLDVGPRIRRVELKEIMQAEGFHYRYHSRSCWLDPYGQSAFQLSVC